MICYECGEPSPPGPLDVRGSAPRPPAARTGLLGVLARHWPIPVRRAIR
jgi:hypothetical protein